MTPLYVLGAGGRIGGLVCGMQGGPLRPVPVARTDVPAVLSTPRKEADGPILVCTRNDDLDIVLAQVHASRHSDLVFVQNGTIAPWMRQNNVTGVTQGVLWVAVPVRGAQPVPGGVSVFSGPWAEPIAALWNRNGVDAAAVDAGTLAREVAVKLAWICATGVVGTATGLDVGGITREHRDALTALVRELYPVLTVDPGLDLDANALVARVHAYSDRIPHFPARAKEWAWRNGAVRAAASRLGVALPLHDDWMRRGGLP